MIHKRPEDYAGRDVQFKLEGTELPDGTQTYDLPCPECLKAENDAIRQRIASQAASMDSIAAKISELTIAQEPKIPRSRIELEDAKQRAQATLKRKR